MAYIDPLDFNENDQPKRRVLVSLDGHVTGRDGRQYVAIWGTLKHGTDEAMHVGSAVISRKHIVCCVDCNSPPMERGAETSSNGEVHSYITGILAALNADLEQ